MICEVEGCERDRYKRSWCNRHYQRWRKYGSVDVLKTAPNGAPAAWFAEQLATADGTCCWVWPFAKDPAGYGLWRYEGRSHHAHTVVLILHGPPRPQGQGALHSCDNPACVNPAHLRWGTDAENKDDCVRRSRQSRGADVGRKLNAAAVRAIRADTRPQRLIAAAYGVDISTITRTRSRRYWKNG